VQGELDAGLEPIGEEPFGQFARFAGAMGRAEKDLFGWSWRALSKEMSCPEIIRTALHHELDFVPGSEMAEVVEIHLITHPAVRALDIQYANGAFGERSNVQASVRFDQDGVALTHQSIDKGGAFILQEGFASGHFHETGVIGRYGRTDILHRHALPFLIGIPGVTVRAPQITPRQTDKEARQSGERGFSLDTEEGFVDNERHSAIPMFESDLLLLQGPLTSPGENLFPNSPWGVRPGAIGAIPCSGRGFCRATRGGFPSPLERTHAHASGAFVPLRGTRDYVVGTRRPRKPRPEQGIALYRCIAR